MKKNAGFTLVELVLILVLLGILGAVAVPKYFDLQDEAQQKAARLAVAEAQSRIEARFSELILNGETCSAAVDEVKVLKNLSDSTKDDQAVFGDFGLSGEEIASTGTEVTVKVLGDEDQEVVFSDSKPKLYVPECTSDGSSKITANSTAEAIYKVIKANKELWGYFATNKNLYSYQDNDIAKTIRKEVGKLGYDADNVIWTAGVDSKGGDLRVVVAEISSTDAKDAKFMDLSGRNKMYVKANYFDVNSETSATGYVRVDTDSKHEDKPYVEVSDINFGKTSNWCVDKEAVKQKDANAWTYEDWKATKH